MNPTQPLKAFLEDSRLRELSPDAADAFIDLLNVETFEAGDTIIREGDLGNRFYIVAEGAVIIEKQMALEKIMGGLVPGDFFGELALFRESTRTATAKAVDYTVLYSMTKEDFDDIIRRYPEVNGAIVSQLYERLGSSNKKLQISNTQLRESNHEKEELGRLFVVIVTLISTYAFMINFLQSDFLEFSADGDQYRYVLSRIVEFSGLFVIVFLLYKNRLPFSEFGLNTRNWKTSVTESILATLPVLALIGGIKYWFFMDYFDGDSIIIWSNLDWTYLTYLLVVPMQELIMRGVFQGSISRLLTGKWAGILAIFVTSLIFGALHLHEDLTLGLMAMLSGFLWGGLYHRHGTLIGVSLSHFLIGNFMGVLGLWDLMFR